MTRCCACDYSPQTSSLYELSLTRGYNGKLLHLDKKTNLVYCTECRDQINEAFVELTPPETVEYGYLKAHLIPKDKNLRLDKSEKQCNIDT